ncbi:MAG: hypothetical protein VX938_07225, partial [Myxococcota bacterium]|nr:hypothetical protein [Myxococcota bacterium]
MSKTALFILSGLALGLLLVTGCAADSGDDLTGETGGENVLVDGTADPANSCFGLCGMYDATKPCQCDALCHTNGDCCTDFCSMCTTASNFADACQGAPACTPDCAGKLCGDDGCGGSCGDCATGTTCDPNGACVTTCGNGVCDAGEDATNCAADCAPAAVCGDGVCDAGEDAATCPQDCAETEVIDSCVGRCDNGYDEAASCQCDPGCIEFGDCCNDLCDNCGDAPDFGVYCGTCTPACDGKICGDDGCGGECGPGCAANETCTDAGTCEAEVVEPPECVPTCDAGWECGDDGCGGNCNGGCPKAAPICDANYECQLTFTVNPCWDQECPTEVLACKNDTACGSLAICLADAPDPVNSNCYQNLEDQFGEDKAQEAAELYNAIQYCGWANCAATEGTCEDQCGNYVGPTSCNCDSTVCVGAEGQCEGDPSNPVEGEVYGCSFYGDCCGDYEALCDSEPECTPQCDGKECGDDGCGGACGEGCGPDAICTEDGLCESTCVPTCGDTGAVCGPDGCGGSCGACEEGTGCDEAGQCTIILEDGTCTSFFADQCGDDENCFVLAGEGSCIEAGSGGEGAACPLDADCAKGTLC